MAQKLIRAEETKVLPGKPTDWVFPGDEVATIDEAGGRICTVSYVETYKSLHNKDQFYRFAILSNGVKLSRRITGRELKASTRRDLPARYEVVGRGSEFEEYHKDYYKHLHSGRVTLAQQKDQARLLLLGGLMQGLVNSKQQLYEKFSKHFILAPFADFKTQGGKFTFLLDIGGGCTFKGRPQEIGGVARIREILKTCISESEQSKRREVLTRLPL